MKRSIFRKTVLFIMSFLLFVLPQGVVFGAEIESINEQSEELEEYLTELVLSLNSASMELSDINVKIAETDENIEKNEDLLKTTEQSSEKQRKDMKKRIKYLYESAGEMNVLEAVLTAESIGDAISRSSYISKIVDYDRKMMDEYIFTINSIITLKERLEDSRDTLSVLRDQYGEKGVEFSAILAEVPEKMAEFGIEEKNIDVVIENFINENPELLEEQNADKEETHAKDPVPDDPEEGNSGNVEVTTKAEDIIDKITDATTAQTEPESTTAETTTQIETKATQPETETAPPETEPATEAEEQTQSGSPNDDPVWNLARITYLENGVMYPESSYRTIYLTACVVINRANAWFGGSIMDSIYAPGAYATAYKYDSWTGGELVINEITWQAVNDALANTDPNPFYQANGSWLESYGLREYYRDPVTNEVFYYAD